MRRSFGCIIPTVRFFFLLGLVLCFCLLRRIFSWERPIKEGFFFLSLDAFSDDVDGVACPPFFFLLLFYNNERNRTFFFFLSSYIFILCVQWVCIPPFPLAVDSLKLISSSVLSNVHTWWIGASHRRHCQSVDTLRSCVCVVLASLEGPLKGALPKRTLVMLLLHFFFIFKKGNLFFFLFVGMWRALVSHLVVCCPPQQGQKSQQRLSIFYVERNYEEWGWGDPEGRSHKLRAYSGRHLRRSGVVWSRLEKKERRLPPYRD